MDGGTKDMHGVDGLRVNEPRGKPTAGRAMTEEPRLQVSGPSGMDAMVGKLPSGILGILTALPHESKLLRGAGDMLRVKTGAGPAGDTELEPSVVITDASDAEWPRALTELTTSGDACEAGSARPLAATPEKLERAEVVGSERAPAATSAMLGTRGLWTERWLMKV